MKVFTTAAVAATFLTTAAYAVDLGNGLTVGGELDAHWAVDAEALTMTLTPEMGYNAWGNDFTVSTDLDVYKNEDVVIGDAFDSLVVDFKVTRPWMSNIELYGETSWDFDAEKRGEISVGATFSF
jgi:hypothetical protein